MSKHSRKSKSRGFSIRARQIEYLEQLSNPTVAERILKKLESMTETEKQAIDQLAFEDRIKWFNEAVK